MEKTAVKTNKADRLNTVPVFRFSLKVFLHKLRLGVHLALDLKIAHSTICAVLNTDHPYKVFSLLIVTQILK